MGEKNILFAAGCATQQQSQADSCDCLIRQLEVVMEGERTPLLQAGRQLDNRPEDEEEAADGLSGWSKDNRPEDEEEGADGPSDCSQWRRQLIGIELAGCLHSFSSGLHEV